MSRHRRQGLQRGRRRLAPVLVVLCVAVQLAGCSDQRLTWLPYEFRDDTTTGLMAVVDRTNGCGTICEDLDGDGVDELIVSQGAAILRRGRSYPRTGEMWQTTFRPPFHTHRPAATLSIDYDHEGDGVPDLLAVACDSFERLHLIWVLDVQTGAIKAEFERNLIDAPYVDGVIDGRVYVLGGAGINAIGGQQVVLVSDGGFDSDNRAIESVDASTGQTIWRYRLGPRPRSESSRLVDLDDDGRREILISGGGVNNLLGTKVNGASDDSSYVVVLNDDGRLRWQHALARSPSGALIEAVDTDGDGTREVIVAGGNTADNVGCLRILDGETGRIIRVHEGRRVVCSMLLTAGPPGEGWLVYLSTPDHRVQVLEIDTDAHIHLRKDVRFADVIRFYGVCDHLGNGAGQIMAGVGKRGLALLAPDMTVLAFLDHEGRVASHSVHTVQLEDAPPVLMDATLARRSFRVHRARWPWLMGGGLSLAGVPLVALGIHRHRRRRSPDDPAVQRELCLGLLGRLKTLRHERAGTLENLDRLRWFTDAAVQASGPQAKPSEQIRLLVQDTRESTLQRLNEVVGIARRVHVLDHRVATLAEGCDRLDQLLHRYLDREQPLDLAVQTAELTRLSQALEVAMSAVREDVELRFRADLGAVVAGVLRAQNEALAGVRVVVDGVDVEPDSWQSGEPHLVQCDPDDLTFIVDNLVGNAARAMGDSATRRLAMSWRPDGLAMVMAITDSGCGIPPEDWSKVLAGDGSTRVGGGFGFRRTREILSLFRGSLDILDSRPGRGTTFELRLQLASSQSERAEP